MIGRLCIDLKVQGPSPQARICFAQGVYRGPALKPSASLVLRANSYLVQSRLCWAQCLLQWVAWGGMTASSSQRQIPGWEGWSSAVCISSAAISHNDLHKNMQHALRQGREGQPLQGAWYDVSKPGPSSARIATRGSGSQDCPWVQKRIEGGKGAFTKGGLKTSFFCAAALPETRGSLTDVG